MHIYIWKWKMLFLIFRKSVYDTPKIATGNNLFIEVL